MINVLNLKHKILRSKNTEAVKRSRQRGKQEVEALEQELDAILKETADFNIETEKYRKEIEAAAKAKILEAMQKPLAQKPVMKKPEPPKSVRESDQ